MIVSNMSQLLIVLVIDTGIAKIAMSQPLKSSASLRATRKTLWRLC